VTSLFESSQQYLEEAVTLQRVYILLLPKSSNKVFLYQRS
jgi:hypothetical protein